MEFSTNQFVIITVWIFWFQGLLWSQNKSLVVNCSQNSCDGDPGDTGNPVVRTIDFYILSETVSENCLSKEHL